jgi:hypothetical protein
MEIARAPLGANRTLLRPPGDKKGALGVNNRRKAGRRQRLALEIALVLVERGARPRR